MNKKENLLEIGRRDHIDLPQLGLFDVEAKIDTGAYGCALHCHQIKREMRGGREVLMFKVLDPDHKDYEEQTHIVEEFRQKAVKSSTGEREERYVINTRIVLFGQEWNVDFSLTDRSSMKYPILLGRKFLSGKFLVNVNLKDLSFHSKQKKNENSSTLPKP